MARSPLTEGDQGIGSRCVRQAQNQGVEDRRWEVRLPSLGECCEATTSTLHRTLSHKDQQLQRCFHTDFHRLSGDWRGGWARR